MDGNPCSSELILGSRSVQPFYGNHLVGNYGSVDKSQATCSLEDSPATLDHHKCMIWSNGQYQISAERILGWQNIFQDITNTSSAMPTGLDLLEM